MMANDPRTVSMACCLMYRGDVVPKDERRGHDQDQAHHPVRRLVQPVFAESTTSPNRCPGGDLAKVQRAVCMISNLSPGCSPT